MKGWGGGGGGWNQVKVMNISETLKAIPKYRFASSHPVSSPSMEVGINTPDTCIE